MKVAVLGSGGREHALCWALSRHGHDAVALPGNGGTPHTAPIRADDLEGVERFCRAEAVSLVIVGPEAPLALGMVDYLRGRGLAVLGPTRDAARLESSKIFSKRFMQRHGVATAEAWTFEQGGDPEEAVARLEGRLALKYDGLAAGKGVWVCGSVAEARAALAQLWARHGRDAPFLVERLLEGDELSIIALTDGTTARLLPPSRDHKRLRDGDEGPNTGGMGAFSPVPGVDAATLRRVQAEIVAPTLAGLRAEGLDYRGFLYFGLMLTADGPRLLEYNVRLGDPEAEAILPLVESDLARLALACVERRLEHVRLKIAKGAAVSVVLASRGYPETPELGAPIHGLEQLDPQTLVFHAGTRRSGDALLTDGGRVLDVVVRASTLDRAIERVYQEVVKIGFEGAQFRRDIGRRPWKTESSASRS